MNYTEANSIMTSYFTGSRRLSNIFWALSVSLGGFGFFLTGLSSFFGINLLFFSDSSTISFVPQKKHVSKNFRKLQKEIK